MDTARIGAGRLVCRKDDQKRPVSCMYLDSGRSLGQVLFVIRYYSVNSDSTSDVEKMWSASCVAHAASERGRAQCIA